MIIRTRFFGTSAPVGFQEQTQSISIDEADSESFRNDTEQSISIANSWTLAVWFKPTAQAFTSGATGQIVALNNSGTLSELAFDYVGGAANDPLQVRIRDSIDPIGGVIKRYQWASAMTQDVWMFFVVTWNGTTLTAYIDGSATAPTSTPQDNTGTMEDDNRAVSFGTDTNIRLHSVGLWDSVLAASEVTVLYNSGDGNAVNWGEDSGSYISSDDLQHWWRLGLDTTDASAMGQDYGISSNLINVGTNAVNITSADAVTDAP